MKPRKKKVWKCGLVSQIPDNRNRFVAIPNHIKSKYVEAILDRKPGNNWILPEQFAIYTIQGDSSEQFDQRNSRDIQMEDSFLWIDGNPTCTLALYFEREKECVVEFLRAQRLWSEAHPTVLCELKSFLHIFLHLNDENSYFYQYPDGETAVVLGGVWDTMTETHFFQTDGVFFHELGHFMLRQWLPNFPCSLSYDEGAIDEGVADAISLILRPRGRNTLAALRKVGIAGNHRDNGNYYVDAAFISAFVMSQNDHVKALADIVQAIQYLIANQEAMTLDKIYQFLRKTYKGDERFEDLYRRLLTTPPPPS